MSPPAGPDGCCQRDESLPQASWEAHRGMHAGLETRWIRQPPGPHPKEYTWCWRNLEDADSSFSSKLRFPQMRWSGSAPSPCSTRCATPDEPANHESRHRWRGGACAVPRLGPLGCAPRTWSRALIGSAPVGSGGFARAGGKTWSILCCRRGRGGHRPHVSGVQNPYTQLTQCGFGPILAVVGCGCNNCGGNLTGMLCGPVFPFDINQSRRSPPALSTLPRHLCASR